MKSNKRFSGFPKINIKFRKNKPGAAGSSPGMLTIADDAFKPIVSISSYDSNHLEEITVTGIKEIDQQFEKYPDRIHWIHIKGFGDKQLFEDLSGYFQIHGLEMEDVLNNHQRPKMEEHEGHIFIVSRMLYQQPNCDMMNDQMNVFLGKNYVISIQEKYDDLFEPVRQRLRLGKGYLRKSEADYLAYALLDSIVDNYFPLMEKIGDQLDELEDELLATPTRSCLLKIQNTKRKLIVFRRSIFAERDKVNDMLRTNNDLISNNSKVYLRDTYDHTIQVMDLVESYKEITASMMDIYLSSVSNRMNQIMKVLAVISTIFIPLTFIVGVYGMNFAEKDQVTGEVFPLNMPELYAPYGYVGIWIVMLLIVILQLVFFYKKGWLTKS